MQMSRWQLKISIFIAVILIGGSLWFRFFNIGTQSSGLVAVTNPSANMQNDQENLVPTASTTASVSASTTPENLTQTDLIGRQMFMDYMSLAQNGQATPENITALANTYSDNIVGLSQPIQLKITDLKILDSSPANLQSYETNLSTLYIKYQLLMRAQIKTGADFGVVGPDLVNFARNLSSLYQKEADEMKVWKVPQILAVDHLALIDSYLSSAHAYKQFSNVSTDPAGAFSAIATQKQRDADEQTALTNIDKILFSNGIIFKTQ
jgi:hypothetical protein